MSFFFAFNLNEISAIGIVAPETNTSETLRVLRSSLWPGTGHGGRNEWNDRNFSFRCWAA
jgi:hypothetical protein